MDTKHKFLRYILPEISHWMRYIVFDLEFQGQKSKSRYWYTFFKFCDIDLIPLDTKHKFLRYILPEISYWMRCIMFDLEFQGQGQGHDIDIHLFWNLRHRFSTYEHQTQVSTMYTTRNIILNALRHVWPWISKSRSQYLHIIFWIHWHQFSGNRHKNYVFITSPSRDIE